MKHLHFLITAFLFSGLSCAAQNDLSSLIGKTPQQILQILGPGGRWETGYDYPLDGIEYEDIRLYLSRGTGNLELFETRSPAVTVLSNFILGGVKVGDPLSRLQKKDFTKTRFGRMNPRNALREVDPVMLIFDQRVNYVLFSEEHMSVWLAVSGGIIRAICLEAKDDLPPGYDASNHIFARQ